MGAITIPDRTMSSREIADLTGSTHDNVLKTVRSLVERGLVSGNDTPYVHPQNGQTYREFQLSFRDTLVVVSGYSPELRARIIDRWQELEAKVTAPDPMVALNDPATMRTLLLGYAEKVIALETTVRQQAPKVELADVFLSATNGVGGDIAAREISKDRPISRNKLYAFLREHRVFMASNLPYQHHVDAGRFFMQATTFPGPDGKLQQAASVRFTPKGIAFCRALLAKHQPQAAQAAEH